MLSGHHALVGRHVRQQLVANHIANGVDVWPAGLLMFIDADPAAE